MRYLGQSLVVASAMGLSGCDLPRGGAYAGLHDLYVRRPGRLKSVITAGGSALPLNGNVTLRGTINNLSGNLSAGCPWPQPNYWARNEKLH